VLTRLQDGKVNLVLRNDYGCTVPPELEPAGGDWWAIGFFRGCPRGLGGLRRRVPRITVYGSALSGWLLHLVRRKARRRRDEQHPRTDGLQRPDVRPYGFSFVQIDDLWQNGRKSTIPPRIFTRVDPQGPYKGGIEAPWR